MAELERAIFLRQVPAELPQGFSRLYGGSEFCCWTFPPASTLISAAAAAHGAGWAFSLVTPVLGEDFLPRLRDALKQLAPHLRSGDEIVLSDWGALTLARELCPGVPLVLGRALSGQKRGPQILDLEMTPEARAYFRRGSWYGQEARALLAENGIARVELDNLLQGIAPLCAPLRGSLHHPYLFVTSSRNCPCREAGQSGPCAAPCGELFRLSSVREPLPLLQCGNTQFARHDSLPPDPIVLGIDRLVFHPHLPR